MYKILPETEGRTLEDIELHFSDHSKKITDHKIPKPKKIIPTRECDSNGISIRYVNGSDHTSLNRSAQNGCNNRGFIDEKL